LSVSQKNVEEKRKTEKEKINKLKNMASKLERVKLICAWFLRRLNAKRTRP